MRHQRSFITPILEFADHKKTSDTEQPNINR
jgi:hypothetical protein